MESSEIKQSEWPMGERKFVEVNGRRWEYREYGNPEGQPLLVIHGWIGSPKHIERLCRAFIGDIQNSTGFKTLSGNLPSAADKIRELIWGLKGKYHVIAPQLPGVGESEPLENPTLDNMADELAAFEKAVGLERPVVFGSSMGGILGIKLAARHPEAVKALIVQGTMTQPKDMDQRVYWAIRIATSAPVKFLLEGLPNSAISKIFKLIVTQNKDFKLADPETQRRILKDIEDPTRTDRHTAIATLRELSKDIEGDINKTQCPVVVLDGANGDLVPIVNEARAAVRFHPEVPNAKKVSEKKIVFLPIGGRAGEHGHEIVNTFPEGTAALVDDVISNIMKE